MSRLLALRKEIKKRKPEFVRQGYSRKKGLGHKWRRPRGRHSKMRAGFRGKINPVNAGYGSPKEVRGLDHRGRKGIMVYNVRDLGKIKGYIIIGRSVGNKKRLEIIKKALENGLKILNIRNPELYLKNATEEFKKRKESKKKTVEVKTVVKEEKSEINEEERKKQENELKKRVLEGK